MLTDPKQDHPPQEYTARINRVIDYIQTHLSQELSLDSLAAVANFSKRDAGRRRNRQDDDSGRYVCRRSL